MCRIVGIVLTLGLFLPSPGAAGELIDTDEPLSTVREDFGLADGPAWDGKSTLYIPDVKGGTLSAYQPATDEWRTVLPEAGRISATYYALGQLYLSDNGESGISRLKANSKEPLAQNDPDAKPPRKPNDLVVDAQGGIYYTLTASGEVMYVSPTGEQQVSVSGIETPNGITMSPDGKTLYVSAYVPKQVWAYTVSTPGEVGQGRLFAVMDDGDAKGADGMTIDSAGNVYCAGATEVWIWSPAGTLLEKITPPQRPINCAFGDADLKTLYITGFGGLWKQRMRVAGLAPHAAP